jgi:hypothetical protein
MKKLLLHSESQQWLPVHASHFRNTKRHRIDALFLIQPRTGGTPKHEFSFKKTPKHELNSSPYILLLNSCKIQQQYGKMENPNRVQQESAQGEIPRVH